MADDIRGELFQRVINYIRETHHGRIEVAYEYFWEEEYPEDFLTGAALELGFLNFEDWLACDYRDKDVGFFIDAYIEDTGPEADALPALSAMKDSVVSLYEIVSAGSTVALRDLALGGEITTGDRILGGLRTGDLFAARFIYLNGEYAMGRSVYPFHQRFRDSVLGSVENQYARYIKNKNPEGDMRGFLKEESYLFNTIWVSSLQESG